jgi:hypothetical protein
MTTATPSQQAYAAHLTRLSQASVDKHWEPYIDIPWEDPGFAVRPEDPIWMLPTTDRLGGHPWYQAQSGRTRARIGLWRAATAMKIGLQFENLLKRGLLSYAFWLPNGSAEFRYVYHETIEEGHHGMMFQEFVNRSGLPVRGMPRALSLLAQLTPMIPWISTELFFLFVLGGEDPIDHVQRKLLRGGHRLHPLQERIMRIHVAEEARHISFARHYLRHRVPQLGPVRRMMLGIAAPVILGCMARIMLSPPGPMVRRFGIPRRVVREAYRCPAAHAELAASVGRLRQLAEEIGIMGPGRRALWRLLGIAA